LAGILIGGGGHDRGDGRQGSADSAGFRCCESASTRPHKSALRRWAASARATSIIAPRARRIFS
jgi:hypothetical protein